MLRIFISAFTLLVAWNIIIINPQYTHHYTKFHRKFSFRLLLTFCPPWVIKRQDLEKTIYYKFLTVIIRLLFVLVMPLTFILLSFAALIKPTYALHCLRFITSNSFRIEYFWITKFKRFGSLTIFTLFTKLKLSTHQISYF